MLEPIANLEDQTFTEDDSPHVPPLDIVAYNELRSCADLFRMHGQKILEIHPEFQRDIVWKGADQTRFIDSLIKQLPIPSMCFAFDHQAQKWIVIDGLQRISTIIRFLQGADWTLSRLEDIDQAIAGKSAAAIKMEEDPLHNFYVRVENLTVPVTVLRCDFKKKNHMDYLFTIFHRLNTGGIKLNNQEIRNCIYSGEFNKFIRDTDNHSNWRYLNKMTSKHSYRFVKQEIILRFFAFHDQSDKYEGHLAKFLNNYMHDHQNPTTDFLQNKKHLFESTVDCIYNKIFGGSPPKKLPVTVLESLLVGVAKNLPLLSTQTTQAVLEKYQLLIAHHEFTEASLREGLSKKPRVIARLSAAIEIFSR